MIMPMFLAATMATGGVYAADAALRAVMPGGELTLGEQYELTVNLDLPEGWSASEAGLPNAVLQLGVPDCMTLEGEVLEGRALQRNEFLQAPFERMMEGGVATIAFTLTESPSDDDVLAVNVLAFAQPGEDADSGAYIRRRVELPIAGGAMATSTEQAKQSSWSGRDPGLAIGDHATSFQLPRADGAVIDLSQQLGKMPIILVTYRAHW